MGILNWHITNIKGQTAGVKAVFLAELLDPNMLLRLDDLSINLFC
jgi:hypothetical protein